MTTPTRWAVAFLAAVTVMATAVATLGHRAGGVLLAIGIAGIFLAERLEART